MPKAHADGTVTNAGLELETATSAARMTVAEYLAPPAAAEPEETDGGEPASPGISSSTSKKKPATGATTNAGGPRRGARSAGNR